MSYSYEEAKPKMDFKCYAMLFFALASIYSYIP